MCVHPNEAFSLNRRAIRLSFAAHYTTVSVSYHIVLNCLLWHQNTSEIETNNGMRKWNQRFNDVQLKLTPNIPTLWANHVRKSKQQKQMYVSFFPRLFRFTIIAVRSNRLRVNVFLLCPLRWQSLSDPIWIGRWLSSNQVVFLISMFK